MLSAQLFYPLNFAVDAGNLGVQVQVGQQGGMQGNPRGTIQPRAWPSTDAVGNPNSFGMRVVPAPYGVANWTAIRPVNNRTAEMNLNGVIQGLMKIPTDQTSF